LHHVKKSDRNTLKTNWNIVKDNIINSGGGSKLDKFLESFWMTLSNNGTGSSSNWYNCYEELVSKQKRNSNEIVKT